MDLPADMVNELVTTAREKIASPKYEVGTIVEMSSTPRTESSKSRRRLPQAKAPRRWLRSKMTYVGAPRYRVRVTADDYKQADKVMTAVLLKMEETIGKHGSFTSKREMSRKDGGGT